MLTERQQRQVDRLLDEAEDAFENGDWDQLTELCDRVLRLDPENADATGYLEAAGRDTGRLNAPSGALARPVP